MIPSCRNTFGSSFLRNMSNTNAMCLLRQNLLLWTVSSIEGLPNSYILYHLVTSLLIPRRSIQESTHTFEQDVIGVAELYKKERADHKSKSKQSSHNATALDTMQNSCHCPICGYANVSIRHNPHWHVSPSLLLCVFFFDEFMV